VDVLAQANQDVWLRLATLANQLQQGEQALQCYEAVLRTNAFNVAALEAAATLTRASGQYQRAIDLYQQMLNVDSSNGAAWAAVAHCYLCVDDLPKAYTAFHQALLDLRQPRDPMLWYGIGVLYDRYGSADLARDAFDAVLSLAPAFEHAADVHFRVAQLHKQRRAYADALVHLAAIADAPPPPLTPVDVLCHMAHVEELRGNFTAASAAYQRALQREPDNPKTLQQFAWYCHTRAVETTAQLEATGAIGTSSVAAAETTTEIKKEEAQPDDDTNAAAGEAATTTTAAAAATPTTTTTTTDATVREDPVQAGVAKLHERAVALLARSIALDATDPYAHYLLGRCCMSRKDYRAAYDAYQHAVYRDGRNAAFWCSIGVLYYHIQQYRDALDAFSRAIRVDARVPEVWFNLGTLYEACRQFSDAGDAYQRAAELAPDEPRYLARLATVGQEQSENAPPREVDEPCAATKTLEARHGPLLSPFGAHMNGVGADRDAQPPNADQLLQHQQQQQQQQQQKLQQRSNEMMREDPPQPKRGRPPGSRGARGGKRRAGAVTSAGVRQMPSKRDQHDEEYD
jgi:general transcriptional corepressor CYC8